MAREKTGATYADAIIDLIAFAREDFWGFAGVVLVLAVGIGVTLAIRKTLLTLPLLGYKQDYGQARRRVAGKGRKETK